MEQQPSHSMIVRKYKPPIALSVARSNYDSTFYTGPLLDGQARLVLGTPMPFDSQISRSQIGLIKIFVSYAWYNISPAYGNNVFQYAVRISGVRTVRTVTVPAGNYTVSELNDYFIAQQIANGDYYTVSSVITTFMSLVESFTQFGITFTANIPTTGTPGPSGMDLNFTGQLVIPADPNPPNIYGTSVAHLLGFAPATNYPTTFLGANYSILSPLPTEFFPVQVVRVHCNLVGGQTYAGAADDVIFSFSAGLASGASTIIENAPTFIQWFDVASQKTGYPYIDFKLSDQNNKPLIWKDNEIFIEFRITEVTDYNMGR